MDDIESKVIGVFVLTFLAFCFLLRKHLSYPFCPLEKYTGRINKGKSMCFLMPHLIGSFGLTVVCFLFIGDIRTIEKLFENNLLRIGSFVGLWFIWVLLLGLIIESYLVKTDQEYNDWKRGARKSNYH